MVKHLKNLKKNKKFLNSFTEKYNKCKKTKRFVDKFTGGQVKCLCEIIKNLCLGNIPIKTETVQKLKPFKKTFNLLKAKSFSIKRKKKVLKQKGAGLFPLLLSFVFPYVTSLLQK